MSERKSKASKPGKEMMSQKHPSYAGKKEEVESSKASKLGDEYFKMIQAKRKKSIQNDPSHEERCFKMIQAKGKDESK